MKYFMSIQINNVCCTYYLNLRLLKILFNTLHTFLSQVDKF